MPKKTRPLTNVEVKSAKSGTADYALYDGDGLLICIKSTGSKIWRVRYSHPRTGKRQTLTVGNFPYVSLIEARKARESARELLRNGIDTQEEKEGFCVSVRIITVTLYVWWPSSGSGLKKI
ncbi:integrase arm-type DNA-binding domain-containing protein [Pantoea stewartii]|uniref:integrase arm-type DNA-binding domain-containing protein n=1 Tax=Pantoea stewartii TaxID=66269 RepID=UPI0025A21730|nr:integrase arm-type DNA-binding domain-containing protein [Pantoea stewartii]